MHRPITIGLAFAGAAYLTTANQSLPFRTTSRVMGKISSLDLPVWMRTKVYDHFCKTYNCQMDEALEEDYKEYKNLSEFFRRRLKPHSRPISQEPGVVSPADGLILYLGPLENDQVDGVKGINYSVETFLGLSSTKQLLRNQDKNQLYSCIVYLAPGDYHRFHSPTDWFVDQRRHFPGKLFSVRPSVVKQRPEVLHINERVCYLGEWRHGFFSMTAVGATNVGSIVVGFDEDLKTNKPRLRGRNSHELKFSERVKLLAGQDFGEFNFGSTVVLIFEAPKDAQIPIVRDERIKFGQLLARIE